MKLLLTLGIILVLVQVIKTITTWVQTKKLDFSVLFFDGGMPSAHSALVSSLTTGVYWEQGASLLFVAVLLFSLIIINDSFKSRRLIGLEAHLLNKLIKHENMHEEKITERSGHTFGQVVVGILFGVVVTIFMYSI